MVSLILCKEYLNIATFSIPVLLQVKSWTFWYTERLPATLYTGVICFYKWYGFLAHPVYTPWASHKKTCQLAFDSNSGVFERLLCFLHQREWEYLLLMAWLRHNCVTQHVINLRLDCGNVVWPLSYFIGSYRRPWSTACWECVRRNWFWQFSQKQVQCPSHLF